jgi:hypothetical protein
VTPVEFWRRAFGSQGADAPRFLPALHRVIE